jgi:prepilin-type N-terminal cleavage/methylation domain-containing protein
VDTAFTLIELLVVIAIIAVLPPGRINSHIAGLGDCWGAYAQMLPELEQQAIFNSFNFNLPTDVDDTPSVTTALANATAPTRPGTGCRSILQHEACTPEGSTLCWPTGTSSSSRIRSASESGRRWGRSLAARSSAPTASEPDGTTAGVRALIDS